MDAAYQKFFKEHAGYPKFKSKHDIYARGAGKGVKVK